MSEDQESDLEDDTLAALAEAADEVIHPTRPDNLGQRITKQDTDGRIVTDVPCKGCQYNLRGQLPVGTCPECGFAIEESLKSEHLRFANLGWLRSLKFGLTWVIIGTLGGTVVYALFQVLAGIIMSSSRTRWNNPSSFGDLDLAIQITIVMEFLVFSIPMAMLCIGYWFLTKPDPHEEQPSVSGLITRWSFLSSYALLIGLRLYILLSVVLFFEVPESSWLAVALIVASAVGVFVGFPAFMVYLRGLARRLPSRKLMRHTSIVLWGFVACFGTAGLLILGAIFIPPLSRNEGAVLLLVSPMAIGVIVFSIWWLVLLFVYQGRLSKAIRSARRLRRASALDPSQAHAAVIASGTEADEDESDDEG